MICKAAAGDDQQALLTGVRLHLHSQVTVLAGALLADELLCSTCTCTLYHDVKSKLAQMSAPYA